MKSCFFTKLICAGNVTENVWRNMIFYFLFPSSVYLVYNGTYTYDGLPAKQFILPKSALENRTNEPENECFCLDENDEGRCPNTGAMFIGACYEGIHFV